MCTRMQLHDTCVCEARHKGCAKLPYAKHAYAFTCVSHVVIVYTGHCMVNIEVDVGSVGQHSTEESMAQVEREKEIPHMSGLWDTRKALHTHALQSLCESFSTFVLLTVDINSHPWAMQKPCLYEKAGTHACCLTCKQRAYAKPRMQSMRMRSPVCKTCVCKAYMATRWQG